MSGNISTTVLHCLINYQGSFWVLKPTALTCSQVIHQQASGKMFCLSHCFEWTIIWAVKEHQKYSSGQDSKLAILPSQARKINDRSYVIKRYLTFNNFASTEDLHK